MVILSRKYLGSGEKGGIVIVRRILFLYLLIMSGSVSADLVRVEFAGTVNQVHSALSHAIFSNDSFVGLIAYNTDAIPRPLFGDPDTVRRYWDSYTQVSLRIGSFELGVPNGA